jgi:putative hydrolase of the HAD superfamily
MGEFVSKLMNVPYAEAKALQKQLFYKHGTTLRGLMEEHGIHPDGFLDYVHDIDYSPIAADVTLADEIKKLSGRKLVFTAGTVAHATRAMDRLGVTHLFDDVFDIIHADYVPKPQRPPYESFVKKHGVNPKRAAMFEDIARNLEVPHEMGMVTVLVTHEDNYDAERLNSASSDAHIHHTTEDLSQFLQSITGPTP